MSRVTYRPGGGAAPTACVRHPRAAVAFQCRACLDSLCEACRAPDETVLCAICQEGAERRRAGLPFEAWATRRRSTIRTAIAVLLALNVVAAGAWTWSILRRPGGQIVDRSVADIQALAAFVEARRAADGRVAADLAPFRSQLPPELARRLESGALRYSPTPDRRSFTVTISLGERP